MPYTLANRPTQAPYVAQAMPYVKGAVQLVKAAQPYVRAYTKQRKTTKPTVKSVNRKVKSIQKRLNHDLASHTHRRIDTGTIKCAVNAQILSEKFAVGQATFLQTAMAGLRYYDPSVPGSLTTANASTGTYSRDVTIKNCSSHLILSNNYEVPVNVSVYMFKTKDDTSIPTDTAWTNSMSDQYAASPGNTQLYTYPSDQRQLNEFWTLKKTTTKQLPSGGQMNFKENSGLFQFDPSEYDSHNLEYQKKWKSTVWLVKVWGVPGHDASGNVGTMEGAVDWVRTITTKIEYDAGTSLNDYAMQDNTDTFVGNVYAGSKPIAGHVLYSTTT